MSSSSLMSIGTRALAANMSALHVTGNNIANVNTPGYSRQSAVLQSSGGQFLGNGFFGKGVEVATVQRAHSDYLTRQAVLTSSVAAADAARSQKLGLVEPIFEAGPNGIGASINSTLNAFADVQTMPTDFSARQVVLARADEMGARLRNAAARVDSVGQGINDEVTQAVLQVNDYAAQVASINSEIASLMGLGQSPNDLLDKRERLIGQINEQIQTTSIPASDGSVNLFVAGSQPLVLNGHAMKLSTGPDTFDPSMIAVGIQSASGQVDLNPAQLSGGTIAGLMQFQRSDLVEASNILGRLALATASLMNDQHHLGVDMNGQPGGDIFSLPALPVGLAATTNAGNATLSLGIADATAFSPSDYEVRFQAGQVDVVRLADGQTQSFASLPAQVDGLNISISAGTAQTGDRYLLKPFSRAAGGIALAVGSPASLAMAAPVRATAATANTGDMSIASIQAIQTDTNMSAAVTLTFNGAGGFDVSGTGTGNPTGVAYVSGQPIEYNGWRLAVNGTPKAGDVITIGPSSVGTRDAQQASGFLALRDKPVFDGVALTDGYASALSRIGSRVQSAQFASDVSQSIASQAQESETAVSGVNLDEEAARLLQYQQAYQASARILQIAQNVFDNLLQGLNH